MSILSSFEVLAELLIPKGIPVSPGAVLPQVPFALQAYFVQISLPKDAAVEMVSFDLNFDETTQFMQGAGQPALQAQFIDETGAVQNYDANAFLHPEAGKGIGFNAQSISRGQTKIYSVTALPPSNSPMATNMAQSGTGWRGLVSLNASEANVLIASPTQRQIYLSSMDPMVVSDSVVVPVPTVSGSLQI
jgi:hypothetical protein